MGRPTKPHKLSRKRSRKHRVNNQLSKDKDNDWDSVMMALEYGLEVKDLKKQTVIATWPVLS